MPEIDFRHEPENERFAAAVDGKTAHVEYAEAGNDTLDYTSTWVPPELRGEAVRDRVSVCACTCVCRCRGRCGTG